MAKIKSKDVLLDSEKELRKNFNVRKMKSGDLIVSSRKFPPKKKDYFIE